MTYKTFYAIGISAICIGVCFFIWFVAVNYLYNESSNCYIEATRYVYQDKPDSVAYWKHKGDSLQKEAEDLHYLYTK